MALTTCPSNAVYVGSKHNYAQLTNIHYWSGAANAWSPNLIGAATPFEMLPNPVAVDDLIVFGVDSTIGNSGPFCNLVFDIERDFSASVGAVTAVWRYGDAGVDPTLWQNMTPPAFRAVLDCTNADGAMTGRWCDTLGVGSVAWDQRFITFAAVNPTIGGVALGVTGYWVCVHITVVAGGTSPPRQQNRDIYTVLWPSIEIDADDIGGDLPAIPQVILRNQSDSGNGATAPRKWQSNIVIGRRSLIRQGVDCSDFSPYLNASSTQNPLGVTVTPNAALGVAFTANNETATGEWCYIANPPGFAAAANFQDIVDWNISTSYSPQYYGTYHAYLIIYSPGTPAEMEFRLDVNVFDVVVEQQYGPYRPTYSPLRFEVIDFGQVSLAPPSILLPTEPVDLKISVAARASWAGLDVLGVYGLVLMPIDEWAGEYEAPWTSTTDYRAFLGYRGVDTNGDQQERYLNIDGYGVPKGPPRAILSREDTTEAIYPWRVLGTPPRLLSSTAQRLWFFVRKFDTGDWMAEPEYLMTAEMSVQQRYSASRGDR